MATRGVTLDVPEDTSFVEKYHLKEQEYRDRLVCIEMVKILRERLHDCVRREEVNHMQNCQKELKAYNKALKKYRQIGWNKLYYFYNDED